MCMYTTYPSVASGGVQSTFLQVTYLTKADMQVTYASLYRSMKNKYCIQTNKKIKKGKKSKYVYDFLDMILLYGSLFFINNIDSLSRSSFIYFVFQEPYTQIFYSQLLIFLFLCEFLCCYNTSFSLMHESTWQWPCSTTNIEKGP